LWRWAVSSVIEAGLDSRAGIGPFPIRLARTVAASLPAHDGRE
jgi:hypothetical protein